MGAMLIFFASVGGIISFLIFYFIHHLLSMSTTPFQAMKAIYVYVAALIGLIVVAMGLYDILQYLISIMFTGAQVNMAILVAPITKLIIGLFIMVPHWAIGHHFHLHEIKKKK